MHCGALTDFLLLDELLPDEARAAREAVAQFVDREFLPRVDRHYEAGTFPTELIPKMAELGLFGATLDGYGCPGASPLTYGVMMMELERGDSGLRSMASVQGMLAMWPIFTFGTEAQKQTVAARAPRGQGGRLLRPHRARPRLRPRGHAHPGEEDERRVRALRREDLDHQRLHRRRGHRLGQARGRRRGAREHKGLPGGEGDPGLRGHRHPRQALHALLGHQLPAPRRLRGPRTARSSPGPRGCGRP